MSTDRECARCGGELGATARFCRHCGSSADGSSVGGPPTRGDSVSGTASGTASSTKILTLSIAGIALLSVIGFYVGRNLNSRTPDQAGSSAPFASPAASSAGRPPDISQMGPDERADRLFQRVMNYVAAGKSDSIQIFAPMAIQSMQALAPLDAHRRYDLGVLGLVSGDGGLARVQADSILASQPDHLLGLILAMRSAGMRLDTLARRRHAARLLRVEASERAKGLAEYSDHDPDIIAGVREAGAPPFSR